MPAYVIVDIKIRDPKEYEEYKKLTPASITAFDGKFIVRGGKSEDLEGTWQPERIVILEFPSADRVRQWWNSAEYGPAKKIRQKFPKPWQHTNISLKKKIT